MIDLTWEQVHALELSAAAAERERIIKFLEDEAAKLDDMRPASYKSVADKMDLRIRTIQTIIKKINEQQHDDSAAEEARAWREDIASSKEEWPL